MIGFWRPSNPSTGPVDATPSLISVYKGSDPFFYHQSQVWLSLFCFSLKFLSESFTIVYHLGLIPALYNKFKVVQVQGCTSSRLVSLRCAHATQTSWLQNIYCSIVHYMMLWGGTCGLNQRYWGTSCMATWRSWGGQPPSWGQQASPSSVRRRKRRFLLSRLSHVSDLKLVPKQLCHQVPGLQGLRWDWHPVWSALSVSVKQHLPMFEQIHPWDTEACFWDVNKLTTTTIICYTSTHLY